MNIMMDLIIETGLGDHYDQLMLETPERAGFYLGYISDMDCESEHDYDPEAIATDSVAKLQPIVDEKEDMGRFLEAAATIAENNGLRLALERAHMQLEDCRAQLRRASCEPTSPKRQRFQIILMHEHNRRNIIFKKAVCDHTRIGLAIVCLRV